MARRRSSARPRAPAPRATPRAVPRTRLDVDERRAQLIALGLDVFSGRAYDEVSIDEVARSAGISKGLLYHYFSTKRGFYVAAIREAARRLVEETRTDPNDAPLARIQAGLDAYLSYVARHGPAYAALLRGGIGSDPEVSRIVEDTRASMLERMMKDLPVEKRSAFARAMLRGWVGFVEAAALDWIDHKDVGAEPLRDGMVDVLLVALRISVVDLETAGKR
jgi:AcrR family transcriptional regulator